MADASRNNENVFLDVPENNDEKEKKERQLSRLQQQIQSKNFSPTTTKADQRKSVSVVSGLSNQQLTEHYSKCIQLSTENKINVNNAFKLQLIDYMSEMLHRRDSEMENFQVASCTLDASAKIYAYRVDSVHTDALKMAGGLGHSQGERGSEHKDEDMDQPGDDEERKEKRKRKKKKLIIEANVKNLNVKGFDLDFEVDPLFKKMSAQFDEGRSTSGPFLTSLHFLDDSCALILDSETVLLNSGKVEDDPMESQLVSVPQLIDADQKMICPTFAPFNFTSWKLGDEDSFCDISRLMGSDEDEDDSEPADVHKFDVNAIPEPIYDDMDCDGDYDMDPCGGEECDTVVTVGQGACQKGPPPLMEAVHLKDHLATNPSEYSYFDSHRMCAWAGPAHWKIRPLSKSKIEETRGDKKKRKELIKLSYRDGDESDQLFAVNKKGTKLSQITLKTWTKEKTTMPLDIHFEARNFFKLFGRPAVIIQRQRKAATVDESVNEYNYDNQNDRENFCAQDDNVSVYGEASTAGYDVTDLFSETAIGSQTTVGDDLENKTSDFLGNLVAAPDKVEKVNIGYARTAKKVDMKKLKAAMWDMLSDPIMEKENCRQLDNLTEPHMKNKEDSNGNVDFSSLYKELPQKLSASMSGNISVPLVFIGLLHLANEHCLKLLDKGNLTDFTIMQG